MDTNPKFLCASYVNPDVFIAGKQQRVGYGIISRQLHEVSDDQGIDAFLFPCGVDLTKLHFDVV